MKKSGETPIGNFFDVITDVLLAGFLWLICSLPVITLGASTSALYYTIVKTIRRKRGTVIKSFFHSFKDNFLQATIATIIVLIYGFMVVVCTMLFYKNGEIGLSNNIVFVTLIILIMPFIFVLLYLFPVISRFRASLIKQIQYSLYFSVGHFGKTFLLILLTIVTYLAFCFFSFSLLIIPGVYIYIYSMLVESIFVQHTIKRQEKNGDEEEVPWYLE